MRFFDIYKFPGDSQIGGDISSNDYLFLGNFIDRGLHSLETMCLLLALKIKYPNQIHLIRGAHEDRKINIVAGFGDECAEKLNEDITNPDSVFQKMNDMFEYLPLGASIGNKIFAVHGGIGSRINRVSDIENLKRPIIIPTEITTQDQQYVQDLLWSEPQNTDDDSGMTSNSKRDPDGTLNINMFGPARIEKFLKTNYYKMIIRSHDFS